ncbi:MULTISPECIES: MurR/RpiR family transcriptional regulator [unclassified Microbulbifer]|uniref:MurR/RpiR family transcriptional regulator n=1 Tax=unclassified Microbulbifer TaxID=2619833 RepID=UPI0027E40F41|nr:MULTISPECIES: MurR/RpiR family transcriptional regulator [unclassified Microbulbifer]
MNCLLKMRSMREQMSVNERKLADFILDNTKLLRDYSSQQLADAVGVSQSSVVKFSQKLGYKGYPSLKLAVHESYALNSRAEASEAEPESFFPGPESILSTLGQKKMEVLQHTVSVNDPQQLGAAVEALGRSRCIQVAACARSVAVARYLNLHLRENGRWSVFEQDMDLQKSIVANMEAGDLLCIVCDMGGEESLVEVAKRARECGAKVLSLTRYNHNAVSMHADIRLFVMPMEEEDRALQRLLFQAGQLHLVESLITGLILGK